MSAASGGTTLALFDRKGVATPLKIPSQAFSAPRVSPDGKFATFEIQEERSSSVFVYELSGATSSRELTLEGNSRAPIWSHDGRWIFFQSDRGGDAGIYRQRADGSGAAERLTTADQGSMQWPQAASPDGALVLYSVTRPGRASELWVLRLKDRKSERLDGLNAREAVFSPDGSWILYQRQPNPDLPRAGLAVFLEPFPRTGARYQLPAGAGHPLWLPGGHEIYVNRTVGRSAIIPVTTKPTVTFGEPIEIERPNRLEPNPVPPVARRNVDAVPDSDQLIGVLTPLATGGVTYEIRVVQNWFEELRQRVPTR